MNHIYKISISLLGFALLFLGQIQAQIGDSIQLKQFNITASRINLPSSFVSQSFDSSQIAAYNVTDLSSFLRDNSGLHLKNYGVGGLSTISFRGTGAPHSKIYWNGILLNSPILGQTDARLYPIILIDNIELHPGSGSMMEGPGALGGNLLMRNELDQYFDDGIELYLTAGSFQNFDQMVKVKLKKKNGSQLLLYIAVRQRTILNIKTTC